MSGSRSPHLQRRNGIYHLRVRVPDDLRLRLGLLEVRRSLRTYAPFRARLLAAKYAARVFEVFGMLRTEELPKQQARALVQACFDGLIAEFDDGIALFTSEPEPELREQRGIAEDHIQLLRCQRTERAYGWQAHSLARRMTQERGINFGDLSQARQADLLDGVSRALIEQQRLFLQRLEDRLGAFEPIDPLFADRADLRPSPSIVALAGPVLPEVLGPSLGEAVESYLAAGQKKWTPKTYASRVSRLGYLLEHLGPATPLGSITPHRVREFRDAICCLRRNHGRAVRQSFAEKQTENEKSRIQPKTAQLIFEPCKAFFRWSKADQAYIATNPAEDVRLEVPKTAKGKRARRPFSADELERLFSAPLFTGCKSVHRRFDLGSMIIKDAAYWIPILGFYTGARLGELVQLHIADVDLSGPIPFLHITEEIGGASSGSEAKRLKSAAAVRKVPLHPDVNALGFPEFVNRRYALRRKSKRLFGEVAIGADGQASTVFSKWFARFMGKIGLSDNTIVFHSFRHNAQDAFRNAGQQRYVIDQIIGHSDNSISAGYGEGVELEVAYEAIKAMKLKIRLPELWKDAV